MQSGQLEPYVGLLADDIEWWDTGAARPLRGKTAVRARLKQLMSYGIEADLHDLLVSGEHLVALIHATARRGDRHLAYSTAEVYHIAPDGLLTKRQAFAQDAREIADFFG